MSIFSSYLWLLDFSVTWTQWKGRIPCRPWQKLISTSNLFIPNALLSLWQSSLWKNMTPYILDCFLFQWTLMQAWFPTVVSYCYYRLMPWVFICYCICIFRQFIRSWHFIFLSLILIVLWNCCQWEKNVSDSQKVWCYGNCTFQVQEPTLQHKSSFFGLIWNYLFGLKYNWNWEKSIL